MGRSIEGTLVTDLAVVTNGIVRKAVTKGTLVTVWDYSHIQ